MNKRLVVSNRTAGTMRSRVWVIGIVVVLTAILTLTWPSEKPAQGWWGNAPALSDLSITDQDGTTIELVYRMPYFASGFTLAHSDTLEYVWSYSADVASSVETVTIDATVKRSSESHFISPADSQPQVEGHQVSLNHGTNIIVISVLPEMGGQYYFVDYSIEITRAGSPTEVQATAVSINNPEIAVDAGATLSFLLSRTGDTTQALTVPVMISEGTGDVVPHSSEGRVEVQFQEGYSSATFDLATYSSGMAQGSSWVRVQVLSGDGYEVVSNANKGSWFVWKRDVLSLNLAMIRVIGNDGTRINIGDFDPEQKTYSAQVESTVEFVTITPTVRWTRKFVQVAK